MNDDNKTPLAYQFRLRMHELLAEALVDGTINGKDWDFDNLGYTVFGGDSLLQLHPPLVADIMGYELGDVGITKDDLTALIRGMDARLYKDVFNRD